MSRTLSLLMIVVLLQAAYPTLAQELTGYCETDEPRVVDLMRNGTLDLNGDGATDGRDYVRWRNTCKQGAVPTPGAGNISTTPAHPITCQTIDSGGLRLGNDMESLVTAVVDGEKSLVMAGYNADGQLVIRSPFQEITLQDADTTATFQFMGEGWVDPNYPTQIKNCRRIS